MGDKRDPPDTLLGGVRAGPVPPPLRGLEGAVLTLVRTVPATSPAVRRCAERFRGVGRPTGPAVERIGVDGRTLTLATGPLVFACDGAAAALEGEPLRCGGAAGKRIGGALVDGRLGLANCLDSRGRAVAFVWLDPHGQARWLAVERAGWAELYPVRGPLPLRVASADGVDVEAASVTLRLAEYASDGSGLERRELRVSVAG